MKHTLKLFAAAAAEMVRTRKARVLTEAVVSGSAMAGVFAALGRANYIDIGLGWTIGLGVAIAFSETRAIYNRMRREQKFSSLSNG